MRIPDHAARQRLAAAVKRRRGDDLHLRQEDVSGRGGPSKASLHSIENASADAYHDTTIAKLEQALLWKPGSIASIVAGGEPVPIESDAPAGVEPIQVIYKGWKVTVLPDPDATQEQIDATLPGILEDSYRRINEAKRLSNNS
jgi:hypothetical protein